MVAEDFLASVYCPLASGGNTYSQMIVLNRQLQGLLLKHGNNIVPIIPIGSHYLDIDVLQAREACLIMGAL